MEDRQESLGDILRRMINEQNQFKQNQTMQLNQKTVIVRAQTAEQAQRAIQARKFVLGMVTPYGEFSVAAKPVLHSTHESALAESKRLAANLPSGTTVVILHMVGGAVTTSVTTI